MDFNRHSRLVGTHAFLSASKYHWIHYDDDKLDQAYIAAAAARRGIELHELAHNLIRLGVRLPDNGSTLSLYVNDGIGFQMSSEQMLFYSENAYGTPDTICFRRNFLRIHDLKTGENKTSVHQLEVYAALFCLEYKCRPHEIGMELRIYQNDEIQVYEGDPDAIIHIMDRIKVFDKRINQLRREGHL